MSVQKQIIIPTGQHHELRFLTGIHDDKDEFTLQISYNGTVLGVVLDEEKTKAVIEVLEDIYYKMDIKDVPKLISDVEKNKSELGYHERISDLQNTIKSLQKHLVSVSEDNIRLKESLEMEINFPIPGNGNLSEMNEKLISENDILRKKVMELKGYKKLIKKLKNKVQQIQEIELFAKQTETHLEEVKEILKSTKIERDGLEATCSSLKNELNHLKNSGRVYIGGETIHSYGLALVAEERLSHFKKGIKIEKDVLSNTGAELAQAALYCLVEDNEANDDIYPSKWNDKFKNKILRSSQEDKLKFAAALLIAQIDKYEYVARNNSEFERKKAGQ